MFSSACECEGKFGPCRCSSEHELLGTSGDICGQDGRFEGLSVCKQFLDALIEAGK